MATKLAVKAHDRFFVSPFLDLRIRAMPENVGEHRSGSPGSAVTVSAVHPAQDRVYPPSSADGLSFQVLRCRWRLVYYGVDQIAGDPRDSFGISIIDLGTFKLGPVVALIGDRNARN